MVDEVTEIELSTEIVSLLAMIHSFKHLYKKALT